VEERRFATSKLPISPLEMSVRTGGGVLDGTRRWSSPPLVKNRNTGRVNYNRRHPMNTVIRKINNSEGVILPKELQERMNRKAGDSLAISQDKDGIVLTKADDTFERHMDAAREIMDRYKVALQKLAE
jgi:putative addiction module antidote